MEDASNSGEQGRADAKQPRHLPSALPLTSIAVAPPSLYLVLVVELLISTTVSHHKTRRVEAYTALWTGSE